MNDDTKRPAARLLAATRDGDGSAEELLLAMVYEELRRLAQRYLRDERPGHTLQPTALVHEAYLRLVGSDVPWSDQAHFFAVAARTMRRILVDHAREKVAVKRGAGWAQATLDEGLQLSGPPALEMLKLDDAIEGLSAQDSRAARASELHYFGGLSYEDTARVLGISAATVHRDLRLAKAWLHRALTS